MEDVVILSGMRTPIGSFQGVFDGLSATDLGAVAIRAALREAHIDPQNVDQANIGCVLTAGLGQAPARQAAIAAGLPYSVPCTTVNKVCGSGMMSIIMATQAIKAGDSQIVVAGGMESMSNAPYLLNKARQGYRLGNGTLIDSMIHDGLWDPYNNVHMGSCADATAKELSYTREQLDAYAAESYRRALNAQKAGRFTVEIAPVSVPQKKGDPVLVETDEEPGRGNPDKLPSLRPAFGSDGVTTAGNASSINDGAAALVLASFSRAEQLGLKPLGRIVASATHAQEPMTFTTAPGYAIEKLLDKAMLKVDEIDLFEINEAFSLVAMAVSDRLQIPHEKLNVNGGAVALGHPIGMTGARLVLTALHELRRRGGKYAVATPCIGGGEAAAILIEAM